MHEVLTTVNTSCKGAILAKVLHWLLKDENLS